MEFTAGEIDFIISLALHPDPSAVRLHDAFGESQSKSRSAALEAGLAGGVLGDVARLVKLAEDNILGSRIHAHARITDNDLNAAVIPAAPPDERVGSSA